MVRGSLFTRFFLEDGIRQTPAYRDLDPARIEAFAAEVKTRWAALAQMHRPSEAETEFEFIYPILGALGWQHLPQQEPGRGRRDIADALLFVSEQAKAKARMERASADRFRFGAVVAENEVRDTPLDRASGKSETPSTQIIRYLSRAENQSGGVLRWRLLTNGRQWRLYWANARARAEGFIELDLPSLLSPLAPPIPADAPPDHWLRVFLLLFGLGAYTRPIRPGRPFLISRCRRGGTTNSVSRRSSRALSSTRCFLA